MRPTKRPKRQQEPTAQEEAARAKPAQEEAARARPAEEEAARVQPAEEEEAARAKPAEEEAVGQSPVAGAPRDSALERAARAAAADPTDPGCWSELRELCRAAPGLLPVGCEAGLCALAAAGPGGREAELLAATLVQAVQLPVTARPELECPQCWGLLHRPTTLHHGRSVCLGCAPRYRIDPEAARLGFGQATNLLLGQLIEQTLPEGTAAAQLRQQGNLHFAAGEYPQAIECYTQAIARRPEAPLFANRSAAHLKLSHSELALHDASQAIQLAPGWPRGYLRKAQAIADHPVELAGCLAIASALGDPTAGQRLLQALGKIRPESLQATADRLARRLEPDSPIGALAQALGQPVGAAAQPEWGVCGDLSIREQLDCPLCLNLLCEPATLACGHSMCRVCLCRALDQAFDKPPSCPLCRASLSEYLVWINQKAMRRTAPTQDLASATGGRQIAPSAELSGLIRRHFPDESELRRSQVLAEEASEPAGGWVPIFVCGISLPHVPTPLHVFEAPARLRQPEPPGSLAIG